MPIASRGTADLAISRFARGLSLPFGGQGAREF